MTLSKFFPEPLEFFLSLAIAGSCHPPPTPPPPQRQDFWCVVVFFGPPFSFSFFFFLFFGICFFFRFWCIGGYGGLFSNKAFDFFLLFFFITFLFFFFFFFCLILPIFFFFDGWVLFFPFTGRPLCDVFVDFWGSFFVFFLCGGLGRRVFLFFFFVIVVCFFFFLVISSVCVFFCFLMFVLCIPPNPINLFLFGYYFSLSATACCFFPFTFIVFRADDFGVSLFCSSVIWLRVFLRCVVFIGLCKCKFPIPVGLCFLRRFYCYALLRGPCLFPGAFGRLVPLCHAGILRVTHSIFPHFCRERVC